MEIRTLSEKFSGRLICILICSLLALYSFRNLGAPVQDINVSDFANYYFGSADLADGKNLSHVYEAASFNTGLPENCIVSDETSIRARHFMNYTPVPPFSLLFYFPFQWLDIRLAFILWNLLTAAFFLFAFFRFIKHCGLDLKLAPLLLLCVLLPLKSNFDNGQSYLLIFGLISEGYISWEKDQRWLAALFWSIAFHLKIFPAFVLLFLLFRKDWRSSVYYMLCIAGIALITILFAGYDVSARYALEILPRLSKGEINNTYAVSYQSMQVFLKSLFVPDALHNPQSVFDSKSTYLILLIIFKGLLFGFAAMIRRNSLASFSAFLLAAMLGSGYGTTYSLVLFIFPLIYILSEKNILYSTAMLLIAAIALNLPIHFFDAFSGIFQYSRLFMLLAFFILFAYLYIDKTNWMPLAGFTMSFGILALMGNTTPSNSSYFFKQEKALLIRNYEIDGNHLRYEFFDGSSQEGVEELDFKVSKIKELPLTETRPYRTWKHVMVNDSIEFFLSDENRGVGFYTIRVRDIQ